MKPKSWTNSHALTGAILLVTLAGLPTRAQNFPTLIQAQSPVDYWRLDETNASPALNIVSNLGSLGAAGTGYVVNGALTGQPGIVGNCVRFFNPGQDISSNTTRIDIPNTAALNPQPPFTVELWAKPNAPFAPVNDPAPPGGLCPLSSLSELPGGGSRSGYTFYVTPGPPASWSFRVGGENSYAATAIAVGHISTTSWTYLVGEYDGTNATFYTNGVLAGSGPGSLSTPYFPNQWMPTRLGGTTLSGAEYLDQNGGSYPGEGNRGWDGWIDEVAIYNTILSSNTIAAHYQTALSNSGAYDALVLASKPVGYWNLDEPVYKTPSPTSFPFAADLGSFADNGTNTLGALADQPGVPGLSAGDKSVFYSGSAGSLVIDPTVTPPAIAGEPITLAAWIKPKTYGGGFAEDILAEGYDELNYTENYLRVADTYDWEGNGDGALPDVAYYEVGTGNPYNEPYYSAIFPAPAGDLGHWVFLAGTYDGANWNLYRNGALVASTPDGGIGPTQVLYPGSQTLIPWSVGSRSDPSPYLGFFFNGYIEEAALFTNALDSDTISNLYNSVQLPPVITQAPQAPTPLYLGASATLSVWADGPSTLSYQWISNDVVVAGATGTNFSLTNLSAAADGTYSVIVTNAYGAVTSSVVLLITPTLPPVTLAPAMESRWLGSPLSFAPAIVPNEALSYQWYLDGKAIQGANQSSYTTTTTSDSAGDYTLAYSNSQSAATSSVATLVILTPPAGYPSTILTDQPIAYFRLDETNGTIAYDYAGGNNGNYYGANLLFGQPGYSLIDADFAVTFPGLTNNYVGDIGSTTIDFPGPNAEFSIEAWANGAAGQMNGAAVIAKGTGSSGGQDTEQFAIAVSSGSYNFFVADKGGHLASATASFGPDGFWHHLVGVCDETGGNLLLYIDGAVAASGDFSGLDATGILPSHDAVGIGAERSGVEPSYDLAYNGTIDEVAIYSNALSTAQIQAHYAAAYGTSLKPFITTQPFSATNYVNLPVTLSVRAAGSVPLSYQWNKVGSGPVTGPNYIGATSNVFTIPNLGLTDSGNYTVEISNAVGGILSTTVTILVLPPPTNPPVISGLVMHLTFDGTMADATGRGNDATNESSGGAPLITNNYVPGQLGEAFSYQTTVTGTSTNANYASVGVRSDLQFGTNSFTVSMWVQLPRDYIGNDLPFFTDVIGSTFGYPGFVFEPTFGTTEGKTLGWPGGWGFSVYDTNDAGTGVYGDVGTINDGGWHNLIYVMDRTAGATVYLDGVPAHQNRQAGASVAGTGNINSTNAATIGQDPTGLYGQSSGGSINIDDLGVWTRALTPLEAASIFTAAAVSGLSFTNLTPVTISAAALAGSHLQLTWTQGSLQSATNLLGPWTIVPGAASPFTTNLTGTRQFFRSKL